jgi:hypothetical protein
MVYCCRFSFPMSYCDPLNCGDVSRLASCHLRFVSTACHFFPGRGWWPISDAGRDRFSVDMIWWMTRK